MLLDTTGPAYSCVWREEGEVENVPGATARLESSPAHLQVQTDRAAAVQAAGPQRKRSRYCCFGEEVNGCRASEPRIAPGLEGIQHVWESLYV